MMAEFHIYYTLYICIINHIERVIDISPLKLIYKKLPLIYIKKNIEK